MAKATTPKPERATVYVYRCWRTCWYEGKRWFAGSEYRFNRELKGPMSEHFEPVREEKAVIIPGDDLAYDVVGREKKRPSEYATEV